MVLYTRLTLFVRIKIPPLEHRNTLLMLNQFIMHTAKFLNRFASVCEEVSTSFDSVSLYFPV